MITSKSGIGQVVLETALELPENIFDSLCTTDVLHHLPVRSSLFWNRLPGET